MVVTCPVRDHTDSVATAESLALAVDVVVIVTVAAVERESVTEKSRSLTRFVHYVFIGAVAVVDYAGPEETRTLRELLCMINIVAPGVV